MAKSRDIDIKQYAKIIEIYIETGKIPPGFTKEELLNKLTTLNSTEAESLRGFIDLPNSGWNDSHLLEFLENIPTAAKFATLLGLASGAADYQVTNNSYSAARTGLIASAITFFGHSAYKDSQITRRVQRKNECLMFLPDSDLCKDYMIKIR